MKNIALSLLIFSKLLHGNILSLDTILNEMAKFSVKELELNAVVTKGEQKSFAELKLTKSELLCSNEVPIKGSKFVPKSVPLYFLKNLIADNKAESKKYLEDLQVDTHTISHGLHEHEPVFIIGAKPGDSKLPQVWIEKNTFLPVKEVKDGRTTIYKWTDKKFPSLILNNGKEGLNVALSLKNED